MSVFSSHDHEYCAKSTLSAADRHVYENGARLTPVRRRVLEILLEGHHALGAYDVLERLAAEGFGHQPPVVYRALEFLLEHKLIHRVQHLNAFVACSCFDMAHRPTFLICKSCKLVAEVNHENTILALEKQTKGQEFTPEQTYVEIIGLCSKCQNNKGVNPNGP